MNCRELEKNLSLYLYGELDFAQEEAFEQHVAQCANCTRALAREKAWHSAVNSEQSGMSMEFLSRCRQELKATVTKQEPSSLSLFGRARWAWPFGVSVSGWSAGVALASLLVFVGFAAGRWVDRHGRPGFSDAPVSDAGLFNPATARIRDIEPGANDRVRIVVDQTREQSITGALGDGDVRQWLLAAAKDPSDPGIRVDSIELLNNLGGLEIRDALLDRLRHDPNAAVRLEALDGLRQFRTDSEVQQAIKFAVEHDYDAGVRSKAMDVLAPLQERIDLTPELTNAIQQILRSGQADEYVQMRCTRILAGMKEPPDVY